MKRSQKISILAVAVGAAAGLALWRFFPGLPWWADLVAGVLVTGAVYQPLLRLAADQAIVDSPKLKAD